VVSGFSSMMDDDDSEVEGTLEFTKVSEDRGDVGRGVFIDAVESNKGVENQEPWSKLFGRVTQPFLVLSGVESERSGGDDLNVELSEVEICELTDTLESSANDLRRILGGIEENPSCVSYRKMSKTSSA
jgi:hypothetical protein